MKTLSRWAENHTWDGVPVVAYKPEGTTFDRVTRQVLFEGDARLPCQWRYFEVADGGHSTLERHEHVHAVMILRGAGQVLLGEEIIEVGAYDLLRIPSLVWHQFRATRGQPLGFLCLVNVTRDRPQLPQAEDLARLRAHPAIAAFLRI